MFLNIYNIEIKYFKINKTVFPHINYSIAMYRWDVINFIYLLYIF